MAGDAGVVILSEVPFGTGNIANLEIAERAVESGQTVIIVDCTSQTRDYTPAMEATRRIAELARRGALRVGSIADMFSALANESCSCASV